MTDRQPFELIKRYPDFELRRYPTYLLAQCRVAGDFIDAGYMGFRPLFNFITGTNSKGQSIAMTAPVLQQGGGDGSELVSFVMPADMNISEMPLPRDAKVEIKEIAGHYAAVIPYRGSWSKAKLEEKSRALDIALRREGLSAIGAPYFARFNPPWVPGPLKQNEVLIAVAEPEKG